LVRVGIAGERSHPSGHGRFSQRKVPDQVNNDLFTIILVLYCAGVVALIVGFIVFRSKWEPVKSKWARTVLLQTLVFALIAVAGYYKFRAHGFRPHQKAQPIQINGPGGNSKQGSDKTRPPNTTGDNLH